MPAIKFWFSIWFEKYIGPVGVALFVLGLAMVGAMWLGGQ